jgi:hypothetical protein
MWKTAAGLQARKLPPALVYPFIAANGLLRVVILIDWADSFPGTRSSA